MKRNWDTIREILTRLEEKKEIQGVLRLSNFPSEQAGEISYHVDLLIDAGFNKRHNIKSIRSSRS